MDILVQHDPSVLQWLDPDNRMSILHHAICGFPKANHHENVEVVRYLLAHGADPLVENWAGERPLADL